MMNAKWFSTYGLLIAFMASCTSYFFLDIPLVNWAHAHDLRQYTWLRTAQRLPEIFPYSAFVVMVLVGIRSCWASLTRVEYALLCTSLSYVIVNFLTKYFKMVFARTWPATWVNDNPSWLNDGINYFHWFADGSAYQSFPSGHTAAMFAVAVVICKFYQPLRWVFALACGMVIAGLISNYHHYLSDIIAGAYLGSITGLVILSMTSGFTQYPAPLKGKGAQLH